MVVKTDLELWILEALKALGGRASVLEVCKHVWQVHESDLRLSGDLFYRWQYDIRWAAQALRDRGVLKSASRGRNQPWEMSSYGEGSNLVRPPDVGEQDQSLVK